MFRDTGALTYYSCAKRVFHRVKRVSMPDGTSNSIFMLFPRFCPTLTETSPTVCGSKTLVIEGEGVRDFFCCSIALEPFNVTCPFILDGRFSLSASSIAGLRWRVKPFICTPYCSVVVLSKVATESCPCILVEDPANSTDDVESRS